MNDADRIKYLEALVLELYKLAAYQFMGMDEKSRLKAIATIDKKVRELGILPPAFEPTK